MADNDYGGYADNDTLDWRGVEMVSRLKHFQLYELVDQATYESEGEKAWEHFTDEILFSLDGLRDFFGRPITINTWHGGGEFRYRGYRPPSYPHGAKFSQHRLGNAFDCDVAGMPANQARVEIVMHQDDLRLAMITRMEKGKNWLHVDCGAVPEGKQRIYLFNP